ncbi:MAG: hypothetical protein KAW52_03695 [candidate division Zixibacteria bacterium]|nr:hypothetical protein [candidate division Zixibacteria bacterium]
MSESSQSNKGRRAFWGIVLVLVGLFILLHNLGFVGQDIIRFWPVLLILWGIKKLID